MTRSEQARRFGQPVFVGAEGLGFQGSCSERVLQDGPLKSRAGGGCHHEPDSEDHHAFALAVAKGL